MGHLSKWLESELGGIRTYEDFQREALRCLKQDPAHSAYYRLLSSIAADFVGAYEGLPLPVNIADHAFKEFKRLVTTTERAMKAGSGAQLETLAELGRAELS